jgi:site-specific DNA-methyltransferase (adenine-specific)
VDKGKRYQLFLGDCAEQLKQLETASVEAVVTDPPYGLQFMGKTWDNSVPGVEVWAECFRVLKPGGYLLAFAGTRTQHRMAVAIEDAGFEIRDLIFWCYGSGYPKALDVSKAIDGLDATEAQHQRRLEFTAWVRSQGVTAKQIDAATGTAMGGHYVSARSQPAIMTIEHLEQCRHLFADVPQWVQAAAEQRSVESKNLASREIVGTRRAHDLKTDRLVAIQAQRKQKTSHKTIPITKPKTTDAEKWAGWHTAIKPACEPITMAPKPFAGTVANNVLEHGTGALNVEACKVTNGGWPSNVCHDGTPEVTRGLRDAARFFYTAKPSQLERNQGCENPHPTVKPVALMRWLCRLVTQPGGVVLDPFMGSGTTGRAALIEGFRFVGIEREREYMEIAKTKITQTAKHLAEHGRQLELF